MCEDCRQLAREIITALLEDDESHELVRVAHEEVERQMKKQAKRIQAFAEEHPQIEEIPTEEEIRSNIWDASIAAMIAMAAAQMASKTDGYIDESGLPASIILGQWAGTVLQQEMENQESMMMQHLLGLGPN